MADDEHEQDLALVPADEQDQHNAAITESLQEQVSEFCHTMAKLRIMAEAAHHAERDAFEEVQRLQRKLNELFLMSRDKVHTEQDVHRKMLSSSEEQEQKPSDGAVVQRDPNVASLQEIEQWIANCREEYETAEREWKRRTLETAECRAIVADAIAEHHAVCDGESTSTGGLQDEYDESYRYRGVHSLEAAKPLRITANTVGAYEHLSTRPPLVQAAYPVVDPKLDRNLQRIPVSEEGLKDLYTALDTEGRGYLTVFEVQGFVNTHGGDLPLCDEYVKDELKKLLPWKQRFQLERSRRTVDDDHHVQFQEFAALMNHLANL